MTDMTDGAGWSEWPAPAKLNLFLQIVGRRADGYHELQTVFQILDWGDAIRLRVRADGEIRRSDDASSYGVAEAEDLSVRAAKLLQAESGCASGCDIAVEKSIPLGGGFGGGSSDAATVLAALNRLWKCGFDEDRLAELGLRLGADVALFVRGRNAWAEGVGDRLTPLDLPPSWFLIVDPGVHAPTAELYRAADLTRHAAPATISDFASGRALGNAFEPVLRRREPMIVAALDALAVFGTARVTGSGGGCFVAFDTLDRAEAALSMLPNGMRAWIAAGAPHSPLLDRLEQFGIEEAARVERLR